MKSLIKFKNIVSFRNCQSNVHSLNDFKHKTFKTFTKSYFLLCYYFYRKAVSKLLTLAQDDVFILQFNIT